NGFAPANRQNRARIVKHIEFQYQNVREMDGPATPARILKIVAATLPNTNMQTVDSNYNAAKLINSYPVVVLKSASKYDIQPGNKRCDGRLKRKPQHQRDQPKTNGGSVQVLKHK